jgi:hypothetical protein
MSNIDRRKFLKLAGTSTALAALTSFPSILHAATGIKLASPHVAIIGGGFAGASLAKYLQLWSNNSIKITLVEPTVDLVASATSTSPTHYSSVLSNLVLRGTRNLNTLTFHYAALKTRGGSNFNLVQGKVLGSNGISGAFSQTQTGGFTVNVALNKGGTTAITGVHRVVVAPGIDFIPPTLDSVSTPYNENIWPHAWKAGPQTLLLKKQLNTKLTPGGSFVITIPPVPFRAHAGPYERASLIADYILNTPALRNGRTKVIVVDENPKIQAEINTFTTAFSTTYANVIEYRPNQHVLGIVPNLNNSSKWDINIQDKTTLQPLSITADVINLIPAQKAGKIAFDTGLVPTGNWAPVDPISYESTVRDSAGNLIKQGIHVIGDAQTSGQSKAGHAANAQAKVLADALIQLFSGADPYPQPVTNVALFSAISSTTASWLNTNYVYDPTKKLMVTRDSLNPTDPSFASVGEAPTISADNFERLNGWGRSLLGDTFN